MTTTESCSLMRSLVGNFISRALIPFHRSSQSCAGVPVPPPHHNLFPPRNTLIASSRKLCLRSSAQLSESPYFTSDFSPHFSPLCDRPAAHRSSVGELLTWRTWAQDLALAVGDKYLKVDGGPDSQDLLRELEWMLEDAVSHVAVSSRATSSNEQIGKMNYAKIDLQSECLARTLKWKDIKISGLQHDHHVLCLRASLEELSSLWTQRVQQRRPFQYVVGSAHWRDFVLCVKEGVLIPRPETEQMIDLAEDAIKTQPNLSKGMWVDLGTGSGALAVGLGRLLDPEGSVVAVDISSDAISIASLNIERYNLQNKVRVVQGSWFGALRDKKGSIAGLLSNPPYIPSSHIPSLQAEVGLYEPRIALDGGEHGTNDLVTICDGAAWALQSDGYIILETNGGGQAESISGYLGSMQGSPFCNVKLVKDYSGIVRFVKAMRA